MNNRLIGYKEAKDRLNDLADLQRSYKILKNICSRSVKGHADLQRDLGAAKKEINLLLSIIASEKRARKLYGKYLSAKKAYEKTLPCLPDGDRSGYGYND